MAEKHNFKVFVGSEAIKTYAETNTATRQSASNAVPAYAIEDDPNFLTLSAGIGNQTNSGAFTRNTLFSVFGRVDYAFGDKYLFNATLRRDQSSKFGANNRTGYFPAVAAGWRISGENFMKSISWLNDLKLRASYGTVGNQTGLSNENRYTTYTSDLGQSYPLQGTNSTIVTTFNTSRLGNPNAKWEQNITTNVGIDASLFNRSLDISVEIYKKQTQGLLVTNQAPYTSPSTIQQPSINAGNMVNNGIDIGLTKRGFITEGMRYELGVTFTKYKNKVTKVLDNPLAFLTGGGTRFGTPPNLTTSGQPISMFYGYKIDGFFNTQEEVDAYKQKVTTTWIPPAVGRWRIQDTNGDGKVDANDRTFIGSPHPDFQMSFNLAVNYKNFDLTGFVFWNQGGSLVNYSRYNVDFNTYKFNRTERMLNDSWDAHEYERQVAEAGSFGFVFKPQPDQLLRGISDVCAVEKPATRLHVSQNPVEQNQSGSAAGLRSGNEPLYGETKNTTVLDPGLGQNGGDTSMGIMDNQTPTPKQFLVGLGFGF